jgi:hypothetical protein
VTFLAIKSELLKGTWDVRLSLVSRNEDGGLGWRLLWLLAENRVDLSSCEHLDLHQSSVRRSLREEVLAVDDSKSLFLRIWPINIQTFVIDLSLKTQIHSFP